MGRIDDLISELGIPELTRKSRKEGVSRSASDEYYVIGLCNEALGRKASQQHKFPFLFGDTGRRLPVDAYYPDLNLVVEYYESQHTEEVEFFNREAMLIGPSCIHSV